MLDPGPGSLQSRSESLDESVQLLRGTGDPGEVDARVPGVGLDVGLDVVGLRREAPAGLAQEVDARLLLRKCRLQLTFFRPRDAPAREGPVVDDEVRVVVLQHGQVELDEELRGHQLPGQDGQIPVESLRCAVGPLGVAGDDDLVGFYDGALGGHEGE